MIQFTGFKFCPHCGKPSLSVHQNNGVECAACGFVYFHNMACGVAGIIETDGKILLMKRAHEPKIGFYDLPGGFVDYRESLEEALAREIREELAIELAGLRYFGSAPNTYRYKEITYFSEDSFFICKPVNPAAARLNDENSELRLVDIAAFDLEILAFDSMKVMLGKYRDRNGLKCV
jgi:ADP-ribose pyrophosphatase YjhB (NUDIX family)